MSRITDDDRLPHIMREALPRLRVVRSDGATENRRWDRILNVFTISDKSIALFVPDGLIEIRGENLRPLEIALQAETVRSITPYDSATHQTPDEGSTIVRAVEYFTSPLPKHIQAAIKTVLLALDGVELPNVVADAVETLRGAIDA